MKRTVLIAALVLYFAVPPAQGQSIGSWEANTAGKTSVYALTQNDSGHVLGQWCDLTAGSCVWLLGIRTSCDEGHKYPALVNSTVGSSSLELYCAGPLASAAGVYRYVFANFDGITDLVLKSTKIGVAIPLAGDQFRVIRFDLNGAAAAVGIMRSAAQGQTRSTRQNTRDEKL